MVSSPVLDVRAPALAGDPSSSAGPASLWRRHQWLWVWLAGVLVWVAIVGIPSSRPQIFAIVGLGLIASCSGTAKAWKRVAMDWAPLYFLLTLYDILRGLAATWLSPHSLQQIAIDRWLFGGTILTVRLQHAFYTPGVAHPWDYAAFVVYMTFSGFVTYALYPAMPPWLASRDATLQPTSKIIDEMWSHVGLANGSHVLSATGRFANPIAAVPSLHAAYPMLLLLFFWKSAPRWRWLLVAYTLAMGLTLVYTGEHYVIDIVLGWLYATVVFVVGSRVFDRVARNRTRVPATASAPFAEVLA